MLGMGLNAEHTHNHDHITQTLFGWRKEYEVYLGENRKNVILSDSTNNVNRIQCRNKKIDFLYKIAKKIVDKAKL